MPDACLNYQHHVGSTPILEFHINTEDESGNTIDFDLTGATVLDLHVEDWNGENSSIISGTLLTDGTDGKVFFQIASGTWTKAGRWTHQLEIAVPGFSGRVKTVYIQIYEAI